MGALTQLGALIVLGGLPKSQPGLAAVKPLPVRPVDAEIVDVAVGANHGATSPSLEQHFSALIQDGDIVVACVDAGILSGEPVRATVHLNGVVARGHIIDHIAATITVHGHDVIALAAGHVHVGATAAGIDGDTVVAITPDVDRLVGGREDASTPVQGHLVVAAGGVDRLAAVSKGRAGLSDDVVAPTDVGNLSVASNDTAGLLNLVVAVAGAGDLGAATSRGLGDLIVSVAGRGYLGRVATGVLDYRIVTSADPGFLGGNASGGLSNRVVAPSSRGDLARARTCRLVYGIVAPAYIGGLRGVSTRRLVDGVVSVAHAHILGGTGAGVLIDDIVAAPGRSGLGRTGPGVLADLIVSTSQGDVLFCLKSGALGNLIVSVAEGDRLGVARDAASLANIVVTTIFSFEVIAVLPAPSRP